MSTGPDDLESLFSNDHFKSIDVTLTISNVTTRTEVKKQAKAQISEMSETGLILEIPQKSCSSGHSLMLDITAACPDGEVVKFSTTARVEGIEPGEKGSGRDRVAVSLMQYEEREWEYFRSLFASRQEAIDKFLAAARGYG